MSLHDVMRKRLLERKGMPVHEEPKGLDLSSLYRTEWSPAFEQLMRNRLVMGAMRYEPMKNKRGKDATYDYGNEIVRRINEYLKTGNKEFLVDVANMALLEFEFPYHPNAHFDNEVQHNIHAKKIA